MIHRTLVAVVTTLFVALACLSLTSVSVSAGQDSADFAKCQRSVIACSKACAACYKHCSDMVKKGDKAHEEGAKISLDCVAVCDATAQIVQRHGPMTKVMCDACAKACDACATECAKYPAMAEMAACKKACDECGTICKTML